MAVTVTDGYHGHQGVSGYFHSGDKLTTNVIDSNFCGSTSIILGDRQNITGKISTKYYRQDLKYSHGSGIHGMDMSIRSGSIILHCTVT